tara:strand:+ start:1520 stop:4129 length:2610 start_codon:yes stop_codon:yes gene_type:complete
MAIEQNPFDTAEEATSNIVALPNAKQQSAMGATFELDPSDGGIMVDFSEEIEMSPNKEIEEWYANLAEDTKEDILTEIGNDVVDDFTADKDSRSEWESMFERGFELLGLKVQDGTEPFQGACTAVHPLLIESAVKFQAKATSELFPPNGPVKANVMGKATPEKEQQANRVQNFMNFQLTEQMPEYFDEFERMLFHLPLIGSAFKKVYYSSVLKRPVSEFIPIDQFYISYFASDLRTAERATHVIYKSPVEFQKDINAGVYRDLDIASPSQFNVSTFTEKMDNILGLAPSYDNDPQYVILEQHCYLNLEYDDEALPYIVTVEEKSRQVLSIRRNYKQDDPTKVKQNHFVHYKFVPGFGFYGLGLIHFLGNLTMTATAAMRSLIDAGQFANLPGGFKAKGVRMVGDNSPIAPGEFKEVEAIGVDLSKAIVPLPYKEPSSTLFQMLNFVTNAGQKFADSTEQVISDAASYGPVGTTMALLEASSKFFSAIHKRLHKSQKDEFRILARIDYDYLPSEYPYDVPYESRSIFKKDFDGRIDIIPVSDPNIPSNAHRMMLANMALQMAQQSPPGMFNLEALNRTILHAANMPNLEEILPPKLEPQPLDPVSDIMAATKGMPISAFPGQNHDAHIQVKMSYMQDPLNGANPIMNRLKPVLESNIQEHSAMKYQEQINGITRVGMEEVGPEALQNPSSLEMIMAQAAQQILNANQAMGQAQSPEQQLVALETTKVELQKEKLRMDAAVQSAEFNLKIKEIDLKENSQLLDMNKNMSSIDFKREKSEADRLSKETMKSLDLLAKLIMQQNKSETDDSQKAQELLHKVLKEQQITEKDLKLNEMNNLSKLMALETKEQNVNERHAETLLAKLVEGEDNDE